MKTPKKSRGELALDGVENKLGVDFIKLAEMRDFTKMAISGATLRFRRPVSTTFVDILKRYNFLVYTKTKF